VQRAAARREIGARIAAVGRFGATVARLQVNADFDTLIRGHIPDPPARGVRGRLQAGSELLVRPTDHERSPGNQAVATVIAQTAPAVRRVAARLHSSGA